MSQARPIQFPPAVEQADHRAVLPPPSRSLAVLADGSPQPAPPEHCLRTCLDGDPAALTSRGCRWLVGAAQGRPDCGDLEDGRCRKGFGVSSHPVHLDGRDGLLVCVSGPLGEPNRLPAELLGRIDAISGMLEQAERLARENEGLADEVLRSYEQLNVIFDFTRQISRFTQSAEIERALVLRLFELLAAERIDLMRHDGARESYVRADDAPKPIAVPGQLEAFLVRQVESVRLSGALSVLGHGNMRMLSGPLQRLDDRTDVVLVRRPASAGEFTSGDLLLLESVLTFAGQLISSSELHERVSRMSLEATRALVAAIDKKDRYTAGHSERVGYLARLTGRELGLSSDAVHVLEWSGLLHDVGKIGIPEEILNKPGRLTDEEFELIKQHPEMGYEILKPLSSFQSVLNGVLYHHENHDGSGYPRGLTGEQIPLEARIIHVVDVFDALTSRRSYRDAYPVEEAVAILREESGTNLDPQTVEAFLRVLEALRTQNPRDYEQHFGRGRGD